ncbi:MAG: ribosome maturation factor RimP [Ignavibacteriaceae bacterium]
MNFLEEKIINITRETVEKNGFFLVDLIIRGTPKSKVIEVYIDSEGNVSAEDCALISREINSQLEGIIEFSYRLDVSSPGVERPLKFFKQYPKNLNRKFELSYIENGETKRLAGKLIAADNEELTFLLNNQDQKKINFNNIKKAKVLISFS